ncbi:MAG TPA: hypothetical protein VN653_04780, partial [Anaerolineales bacterium]|nr:hypothetical protein [Anaerolineales bacterium]
MSNTVLQDGFAVIVDQWQIVFGILILLILSQAMLGLVLRQIFGRQLTSNEYLALSLAGWILPAALISMLWIFIGSPSAGRFNLLILTGVLLAVLFLMRFKTDPEPVSKPIALFLLLFLLVSILLRLAFVSRAVLPSYFDSAQHYQLIKSLLAYGSAIIFTLQASYYHLGFHILTAFVVSMLNAEIARTMLVLGQIILAAMPISVFFPVSHLTKSNWAAIFAVVVSAWGWYMPAHAVDWGKYPALTSIGLIPFVLSLAHLFVEHKDALSARKRWALAGLIVLGSFITVIIHSRSLFILGIASLAWIIAVWWQRRPQSQRFILFFIIVTAIVTELFLIQKQDVLTLLLDPYSNQGLWITSLTLFLALFAWKDNPLPASMSLLAISFILGSVFIPVPDLIPGYRHVTVLDRPFVEMFLYLPLSLLGGLGLAGVENFLQQSRVKLYYRNGLVSIPVIGLVLVNTFAT